MLLSDQLIKPLNRKRIYICVTNDLVTDQRADRTATFLYAKGHKVTLIGRYIPHFSLPVLREYDTKRFRLLFRKGFLFYATINMRLFFYLLTKRISLLVANDLDTLLPCYLISKLLCVPLIYDSHEYFTEVPELAGRKSVRNVWLGIERFLLPRIRFSMTVNESLAGIYRQKYGITMEVVRNLPRYSEKRKGVPVNSTSTKPVILYQGALNKGRGLEGMILAMNYLDGYELQLIGDGDIRQDLVKLASENRLEDRVKFPGRKPFHELAAITTSASLGISLEEQAGMNYYYALPNKLFDYIQARIPVLVSAFPEMKNIVETYRIGICLDNPSPQSIAIAARQLIEDKALRAEWMGNLEKAANELCWEKEVHKLERLINTAQPL